jgi:sec-independent protein translocase protein TatA|tara:strand:- start:311 stop:493 length:183 start_codon:yes stop_codon:yes gene_type:complete
MFGIKEIVIVLIVVLFVLLFFGGTKRLKNLGSDLGNSLKGFRKAMNEDEQTEKSEEDKEK